MMDRALLHITSFIVLRAIVSHHNKILNAIICDAESCYATGGNKAEEW
ncbi:hypothetical protein KDK_67870 [Dictyobacter kobayashii]|uniref:Uncharacterized protein n=1 Tax=Dictyobacter kobayashii TaxID=2014872 RepID=A0A402AV76_9CHLR|nr:hypothetical protein KDK_67870 [Dictyobacter kobayashii]